MQYVRNNPGQAVPLENNVMGQSGVVYVCLCWISSALIWNCKKAEGSKGVHYFSITVQAKSVYVETELTS